MDILGIDASDFIDRHPDKLVNLLEMEFMVHVECVHVDRHRER